MNFKTLLIVVVAAFFLLCGGLVVDSVLRNGLRDATGCVLLQRTTGEDGTAQGDSAGQPQLLAGHGEYTAAGGPEETVIIGAQDPDYEDPTVGFKFQLELSSRGAAIKRATFSNGDGKGFDDRDPEGPKPLVVLSPVAGDVLSMANRQVVLVRQNLLLDLGKLSWKSLGVETAGDGSQTARFEATIADPNGNPFMTLVKTYAVRPGDYDVDCTVRLENKTDAGQEVRWNLTGPVGIGREDPRGDMRKVVEALRDPSGEIVSSRSSRLEIRKFDQQKTFEEKPLAGTGEFLWAAVGNKYFAAILVPLAEEGNDYCKWIRQRNGLFYNPDGQKGTEDEEIGLRLKTVPVRLAAAGEYDSSRSYNFKLYIGPKDKSLFDKNERYRKLGFVQVIDFMGCCCPVWVIRPLAFAILAIMKVMHSVIGNYGVVIIILVLVFRIVAHPLTKKSQVSMSKMSKLGPKAEEIRKKYANNKVEMNRQMMALYREQGASPVIGMLPMFAQMPVWIALWTAVSTGIDLRGAPFLPFWITDLSAPDALFRFPALALPLFGKLDSFNLLPILMGVAFYLQQKLMPSQQQAANPQAAQQQKMMMVMMPILFPLMLYKGPSGVNLYIMASVFAGVFEQHYIRKHIREKEQQETKGLVSVTSKTGGKAKKKKPKPFFKTYR
jgi:YidC/Oxa1 family membrane protein insertase